MLERLAEQDREAMQGWLGHRRTTFISSVRNLIETGWSSYLKIHMLSLVNSSLSCFGGDGECFPCHQGSKDTKIPLQIIDSFLDRGRPKCRFLL